MQHNDASTQVTNRTQKRRFYSRRARNILLASCTHGFVSCLSDRVEQRIIAIEDALRAAGAALNAVIVPPNGETSPHAELSPVASKQANFGIRMALQLCDMSSR